MEPNFHFSDEESEIFNPKIEKEQPARSRKIYFPENRVNYI